MNAEQQMKEALDGKFVSFRSTDYGMQFFEKKVSVNFRACYSSRDSNIAGAKRDASSQSHPLQLAQNLTSGMFISMLIFLVPIPASRRLMSSSKSAEVQNEALRCARASLREAAPRFAPASPMDFTATMNLTRLLS